MCVCEWEDRTGRGQGGGWEILGGEAREQLFTRADQDYRAFLEDETGGRGLLTDKLGWLCFISQWLHTNDLWTFRLSNTRGRQLKMRQVRGRGAGKSQRQTQKK